MSSTDQQIASITLGITTYGSGIVFILGAIGNTLNILVFCCLKTYRPLVTSTFLAMTSFSGQLYITFTLGFSSISKWIGVDIPSRNAMICRSILYLRNMSLQICFTCLCLSSIERYLMTSRSARRRELMTLKRARLLICICFVVWMSAAIPSALFFNNLVQASLCVPSVQFAMPLTYYNLVCSIFLPVTILSIFGFLTWRNLANTRLSALNAQVTRMILLDIMVVALSNLPLGIFLSYVAPKFSTGRFTPIESLLITVTQLLRSTQAFGSFYFYMIVSLTFRNNVKNMLRNIFCFWKPKRRHQIAPSVQTAGALPSNTAGIASSRMPNITL